MAYDLREPSYATCIFHTRTACAYLFSSDHASDNAFLETLDINRVEEAFVNNLMNEPVSLLDFGIFRLETFLKSKDINNFFKVGFDSDDKKIVIIFAYFWTEDLLD